MGFMRLSKLKLDEKRLLWLMLALSVVVRLAAAVFLGNEVKELPGTADQVSYHTLAVRVLDGHGFTFGKTWWPATRAGEPTAHWSYLYTFYLIAVYTLVGVTPLAARFVQAGLVGLLQPLLAYLIGRRLYGSWVGLASAGLTAVYVYFVYYAGALMTESFYITAILASLYLAIRLVDAAGGKGGNGRARFWWLAAGFGVALGVTVLLRQLYLLYLPFLFGWMIWMGLKETPQVSENLRGWNWRQARRLGLALALAVGLLLLFILPVTAYNYSRFNRFVLLNTNAGYAFFWANHPIYGNWFIPILPPEMGTYPRLIPRELRHLDEAALDQALLREGIQFVVDDPVRYVRLSLSRIPAYFIFWPSADSSTSSNLSRVVSFGILWPFMLYGLIYSFVSGVRYQVSHESRASRITYRASRFLLQPAVPLYLFVLVYTAIHLLSWALIRYRLPVDAVLLIFAGLALEKVKVVLMRRYHVTMAPSEQRPAAG
jgi:4-amino-4-deoxy-L-arabinose transferase-like glycosyltransferase